jgi:N-acetylglucosaminyl-diphospho-decaprenol L-rhamnosyltransferase
MSIHPPSVQIVVVAYNSRDTLRGCVEPLAGLPSVDVTVVDNACPERSSDVVADLPVRVLHAPRNGGFAYGCNLGMATGRSELVLLLNPDARITPESLAVLVRALHADARLAVAGPRTLAADGALVWSRRRFPRLRSTYAQALFLQRLAPHAAWSDEVVRDREAYGRDGSPDWLSGACLLLRRSAVDAVGGLDEGFFLYSEETDLVRRLRDAGWGVRYVAGAVASHIGGASAPRHVTKRIWAQSRVRYARKHHGRAVAALEAVGVALGALTHAAAWSFRPRVARGHATAGLAALRAIRT